MLQSMGSQRVEHDLVKEQIHSFVSGFCSMLFVRFIHFVCEI